MPVRATIGLSGYFFAPDIDRPRGANRSGRQRGTRYARVPCHFDTFVIYSLSLSLVAWKYLVVGTWQRFRRGSRTTMADVTTRREGELQRGVFKILLDHPEGLPAKEVLKQMERVTPPTDFEKSDYPNNPGIRRFGKMIRFATIAPVKAGWMIKDKGRWYLTEVGKKAYSTYKDPEEFRRETTRLYYQWIDKRPKDVPAQDDAFETIAEDVFTVRDAVSTFEEAEETAWSEIESFVQAMNPFDLQKLVAALLRAMGYHVSWIAPPGPDKGIDIVAHNDPLGTSTPRIKVQVKRRADKINVDGLRSFMAILGEQDVGIFVSTGGFTSDAESEARTKETRKITLLNLEQLVELWMKNYDKIEESDKVLLPLKPVHYLALSE
jgi:restriction system protein